ncbi:MAG: universal stress protein [Nitrososphaerota archaeon]|jgi:nucleotide-binding universal stress UspA family protein|nr:universal stress protein [Nitrososphaerota archaeon]
MASIPRKILVAVDGSEGSLRAADFAVGLASKLESEMLFINVVGASTTQRDYRIPADMVGSFEAMGSEALSKCEEKAKENGVKATSLEVSGNPVEEILESSREAGCDCIILGKSGLGKIERLLMGSVSESVTKLSDVPVIIVS